MKTLLLLVATVFTTPGQAQQASARQVYMHPQEPPQASTKAARSRFGNSCRELASLLGGKSLSEVWPWDSEYEADEFVDVNLEGAVKAVLTGSRSCILSPRSTRVEREVALNIHDSVQRAQKKKQEEAADRGNQFLRKCSEDMDRFRSIAQTEPGRLAASSTADEFKSATLTCENAMSIPMSETRVQALSAMVAAQLAVRKADLESFDKIVKALVSIQIQAVNKYNQLVDDYNSLLERSRNIANLAYQMSQRPVFQWTPPPPQKQIHCTTSGNINTYGYSSTISAYTDCQEY